MGKTSIEWCDYTLNPWWGCEKVSPGCKNCYAETLANRFLPQLKLWGPGSTRRLASDKTWDEPIQWDKQAAAAGECRTVFCGSMCDVMESHPLLRPLQERLKQTIWKTPRLIWLILTKRPENLPEVWGDFYAPNVCLMVSVENQDYAHRIDAMFHTRADYYGVSYEPALGAVDFCPYLDRLSWVIFGGESGDNRRPVDLASARSARDQCASAGVPFFMKQVDKKQPIPDDLMIRQVPAW